MGCLDDKGPGTDGCFWPSEMGAACDWTWSSTPAVDPPGYSCFAPFRNAHLSHDDERSDISHHVICAR